MSNEHEDRLTIMLAKQNMARCEEDRDNRNIAALEWAIRLAAENAKLRDRVAELERERNFQAESNAPVE